MQLKLSACRRFLTWFREIIAPLGVQSCGAPRAATTGHTFLRNQHKMYEPPRKRAVVEATEAQRDGAQITL